MLLSALKNKQIDKREGLTEAEEFEVVKKEIKQTKETMESRLQTERTSKSSAASVWRCIPSLHRKKCQRTRSKIRFRLF